MNDAGHWLEPRLREIPASLRCRIQKALDTHLPQGAGSPAQSLRSVADALLEEAKQGGEGDGREVALTLLAADALVTYACEIAAEMTPERLGELR